MKKRIRFNLCELCTLEPLYFLQPLSFICYILSSSSFRPCFSYCYLESLYLWLYCLLVLVWLIGQYLLLCWRSRRILTVLFPIIICGIFHLDLGRPIFCTDIPIYNASYLIMLFSVGCSCLHLTPCYCALNYFVCASCILGPVDPCFYEPGA